MKKFLLDLEDHACALVLLIMLILTFVNVVARYVFLSSMPFVEELTCLGLLILSLVGVAVAAKRGAHLGLSVITDLLPQKAQKYLSLFAHLAAIFFSAVLIYYGSQMVVGEYVNKLTTAGMQWPVWLFGIWVPLGGAVMLIRYIYLARKELKKMKEDEQ